MQRKIMFALRFHAFIFRYFDKLGYEVPSPHAYPFVQPSTAVFRGGSYEVVMADQGPL